MNDSVVTEKVACPLWVTLLHAAQRVEGRFECVLAEHGLSIPKLGVLKHLVTAGEPLPLSRLAERMSCVKSNITQLVDRLEADGLVERVSDPSDRRSVLAQITAQGRERFDVGASVIGSLEQELFGDIAPADRVRIEEALAKLSSPCGG